MIEFIVRGERIKTSKEEVIARMEGVAPEPLRALVVEVGGVAYPVKQVFALAFDLDRADFISHQARGVLRRLGFHVRRIDLERQGSNHSVVLQQ